MQLSHTFHLKKYAQSKKASRTLCTCHILLGSVKHTQQGPCLTYDSHITFQNLSYRGLVSYVVCVCYVEQCKFSTSTNEKYRIVQNIISAICGYFYGFQNPSGGSEIAYILKKVQKRLNPCRPVCRVTFFRDILRTNNIRRPQGGRQYKLYFESEYQYISKVFL